MDPSRLANIFPKQFSNMTASKQDDGNKTTLKNFPGSDWGRAGWTAVFAMWIDMFFGFWIVKCIGILLPTLQYQLDTKTWVIGWMTSIMLAMTGLIGPFAAIFGRRFGNAYVIMFSGLLGAGGFILGSLVNTSYQLAFTISLLTGTGIGIVDILTRDAVGRYFSKNYAIAVGISRTGVSIGMLVSAPLSQLFLNTYGWRGTMLLTGGITMHIILCGALLMTYDKAKGQLINDYHVVSQVELSTATPDKMLSRLNTIWKYFYENMDLKLFVNVRYWSTAFISCMNNYSSETWIIYFVSQAQSNGFSLEEAASFISVAGVANLIAKFLQGFIVKEIIPCWGLMSICIVISTASLYASAWVDTYWAMMTVSCLVVFTNGMISCLNDVLTKQLLGVELLAGAFGWIGFKLAVVRICIGFLPGLLYDILGNYKVAFIFLGAVQFSPLIPILCLRYFRYVE